MPDADSTTHRPVEPIVRMSPVVSNVTSLVFVSMCVFGVVSLLWNDGDGFRLLWLEVPPVFVLVVGIAALVMTVDSILKDHCLVSRHGDLVVVHLPFRLDSVMRGYRFDGRVHDGLQVLLRTDESKPLLVFVIVEASGGQLRQFRTPLAHLDTATRAMVDAPPWRFGDLEERRQGGAAS
jgi:hypothetical protein